MVISLRQDIVVLVRCNNQMQDQNDILEKQQASFIIVLFCILVRASLSTGC